MAGFLALRYGVDGAFGKYVAGCAEQEDGVESGQ